MSSYKNTRYEQKTQCHRLVRKQPSPSKNVIYSSLAVEDEQKEIIISKLKQEITLLQGNQKQFQAMKEHYKNLDRQFMNLAKQKEANDDQFAKQHERALRQICQIKNEIDLMKGQFREKKLQIQDLAADQNTLRNQLDQKHIEIQKLKNQLQSSIADTEELQAEHHKLQEIYRTVNEEKKNRQKSYEKLMNQLQNIQQKLKQLEEYLHGLKKQQKIITDKILNLQEENNHLDDDIEATCEDLNLINGQIEEAYQKITDLQRKLASITSQGQKFKSQTLFHKKSIQNQIMNNNELHKNISQSQNLLKVRENQVLQGRRELQVLTQENTSLEKINTQLEEDLEACKRHLENLAALNGGLVEHMEKIDQEDEQARTLIDRRQRVQMAGERVRESQYLRKDYNLNDTRESNYSGRSSYRTSRRSYL